MFPCLALNYLGQGATVLDHPAARHNPFWAMAPGFAYWPILVLATAATVIASQALIIGRLLDDRQAVQLGLFPRMDVRRTSETLAGQIFVPSVNVFLMIGVLLLLLVFQTSSHLASAYGLAVTGAMLIDTLLAFVIVRRVWKWRLWQAALLFTPIALVDLVFIVVEPAQNPRRGMAAAGHWRRPRRHHVDLDARRPGLERQDPPRQPAAGRPDRDAARAAALPRAGHGHLS